MSTWSLIRAEVATALATAGVATTGQFYGAAPLDTYPTTAALLRNVENPIIERGNNVVTRAYRLSVDVRVRSTSATGTQHYTDLETLERAIVSGFSEKGPADFTTITGLQIVRVEPKDLDAKGPGGGRDIYSTEARALLDLVFIVDETR